MNTFLFFLFFLAGFSCKKSKEEQVNIEALVDIKVVDTQNDNLIGQAGTVDFKDLKIFYVINGDRKLFVNNNLNYSKGYTIIKNQNGEDVLRLFLNMQGNLPLTLLQYNNNITDMVKCAFSNNEGSTICPKIWSCIVIM